MRTAVLLCATTVAVALGLSLAAAPAAQRSYRLTVAAHGAGTIRSADGHLSCGARCSRRYRGGALVTLRATAARDFAFEGWSAGCIGTAPSCTVAVERATTVRAVFVRLPAQLGVTVGGAGTVTSEPAGIRCPAEQNACRATFGRGETVTLAATPAPGSVFVTWGQDCATATTAACDLTLAAISRVTAVFGSAAPAAGEQSLTVSGARAPVVSAPPGIQCPETCAASFASGTLVTLTAQSLISWGGACAGVAAPCTVAVDRPVDVIANTAAVVDAGDGSPDHAPVPPPPAPPPPRWGVNVSVSGPGRVEASGGIRCGYRTGSRRDCSRFFDDNSNVVLRAVPRRRARFVRWGSFCRGTRRTCRLRVTATKSVVAVFGRR